MKALDIMEAAGGIDDEILMEVTSAMQEKNTGKPLRAKRTLRTVLIAAALVLVLAGSALAAGRLINSPAQAVKVARQEIAKMQDMGILSSEYRFFDGELPEVVISLKKTAGAYGHFTTGKVWKTGEERRYEINISSASLNQECAFLAGVLVHEMVHEYCAEHGIKDTSNNGVYHNKNFKHIAETHGLEVEHHPKYGWTITSPGLELLDFVEEQGWQDFQMVESLNLLDVLGTLPKGGNSGAGAETRTKKPSSTRKYICPKCGNSCRATKVINLICGDCMEKMVVAE